MLLKQDDRVGEMTTPLGKDVLVARIRAVEGLSELLYLSLFDAYSENNPISTSSRRSASNAKQKSRPTAKERAFNGILEPKRRWVARSP